MSYTMKIKKAKGAAPDDFEAQVAQELMNLEVATVDMKADLHDLYIVAAKELELPGGRKAIVIFVPFKQLKDFHKIQGRLIRELEKKFRCVFAYFASTPPPPSSFALPNAYLPSPLYTNSGRHVIFVAQRTILPKSVNRKAQQKGPRSRSRTLTAVQEAILEDIVYPVEIVGKRIRYKQDGSKTLKVLLDPKEQHHVETKLDTFGEVYRTLTNKEVSFEFPVQNP